LVKNTPPPTHTVSVSSTCIRLKWILWLRRRKSFTFKGGRRLGDLASATWSHSVFFFFGWNFVLWQQKQESSAKCRKSFCGKKDTKFAILVRGKKSSEVAIFSEWVPVGRQNKAGF
jgi:hypothetical protein